MGSGTARATTDAGPAVGDLAPAFTLPTTTGATIRRHDYRGRRHLVLAFAHGPGCAACAALLRDLAARYDAFRAEGAEVLAILPAEAAVAAPLTRDLPYPVLCDRDGGARARYGAQDPDGAPRATLLVADRYGEVVWRATEPDGPAAGHGLAADEALALVELLQVRCSL
ncbi:MAG TPA: peroxiredoxin family protein [Thermomicrobiales bacterium]|nr:peroxiredoxin family protein [Thermomicrobiales bacterium]